MIGCEEVNNVSIVFDNNGDTGFQLPANDDCECVVGFEFDYMLKYSAGTLIECAEEPPLYI